jgi:hypothetical protein
MNFNEETPMKKNVIQLINCCLFSILLTSCGSDSNNSTGRYSEAAIINTAASDYSDSDIELINIANGTLTGSLKSNPANYANGLSDYSVVAYGEYYYRIGRYGIDTITKYSIRNPRNAIYSYSTLDNASDPTSNPYQLVFLNETKAYLIRYNTNTVWIVNPSADNEGDFKIGEIDLSHYNDGDGSPEMSDGVIVADELFITMQRQNYYSVIDGNSWIAVIDTTTDEEIIVDALADFPGIQLKTNNPSSIVYNEAAGLYVQSIGSYTPEYIGGIEKISLLDYSTTIMVDDGDDTTHPYGLISNMVIFSDTVGYFVGYLDYGDNVLHQFNPTTGAVSPGFVANLGNNLTNDDIRSISSGPENSLWVSLADLANPRVLVIDTSDNTIADEIETTYSPTGVVFASIF